MLLLLSVSEAVCVVAKKKLMAYKWWSVAMVQMVVLRAMVVMAVTRSAVVLMVVGRAMVVVIVD